MPTTDVKSITKPTKAEVDKIIKYHLYGAMGVGTIPVPLVDLIAISGIQINMLRKLCQLYDIPFSKDAAKSGIAALLGGVIPVSISGTLASLVKAIPIVGQTSSVLVMPAISGAMTYAVGKVFVQHFESGGTFLNFKPEEVRAYYQQMFEEGKDVASDVKPQADDSATTDDSAPTPKDQAKSGETKTGETQPDSTEKNKFKKPYTQTGSDSDLKKDDPEVK